MACFEVLVAVDTSREKVSTVVRQGHLVAVVVAFVIGCAVLLAVGCAGTSSGTSEKEQEPTEATKKEQGSSPKATESEEARCDGTQPIDRPYEEGWLTNDVPSCSKGGLLSGTDGNDMLDGLDGDDEIRGLGAKDQLIGGLGSDAIFGGPGKDFLKGSPYTVRDPTKSKDVLHGGPGNDALDDPLDGGDDVLYGGAGNDRLSAGKGEDVIYGGDGNDLLDGSLDHRQRDELYCGKGRDEYAADKNDYVDSSCEKKAELIRID